MTINIRGRLLDLSKPLVMGIINANDDSFYPASRVLGSTDTAPLDLAARHVAEGAAILDVGACSTRPGSDPVSAEDELRRLDAVLPALRSAYPDAVISLDTFRADVVAHCVEAYGIDIVNDVSAGLLDPLILQAAADLHLPYVLTHGYERHIAPGAAGAASEDNTPPALARFFAQRLQELYALGVADVILDPGFGFGKTRDEDYAILRALPDLIRQFPQPWLIGLSRKRMAWEPIGAEPATALNATTVLNTVALMAGAHIIRVHDVRPAAEAVALTARLANS